MFMVFDGPRAEVDIGVEPWIGFAAFWPFSTVVVGMQIQHDKIAEPFFDMRKELIDFIIKGIIFRQ